MLKKSIIAKILMVIAAVLLVTDAGLLTLGFSSVYRTVHNHSVSYAKASAAVAADLLEGVDMEALRTDGEFAASYKRTLEKLCRTNGLVYLYVYTPDRENKTITFVMVLYGEKSRSLAAAERVPGTVIRYELSPSEVCAWEGKESENVEETDNSYGHVMTSYSAVYDRDGNVSALVGADVSMDEEFQIFFRRYRIMVAAVVFSFVFVLGALAAILKARVLKPAETVSRRMKNFISDRQSGFEKIEVKGQDELAQMADAFNHMAGEIDEHIKNIQALTEEKHRREAEISIARNIQRGLLPEEDLVDHGIRLTAVMIPANYVGGDFYDYFRLPKGRIGIVIADVSGKGISAALFMARAITVVRQYAKLGYAPAEILFHTNNALSLNNPEQMFLTLFVGVYDSVTRRLAYANGGHNTPYLVSDTLQRLDDARGMTVGLFEDEVYEEGEREIRAGDTVFLYTDGVNEAVSREREFFGTGRLEHILKKEDQEKCAAVVLDAVKEFAQGALQSDDITMLALHVLPGSRICVPARLDSLDTVQAFVAADAAVPDPLKNKLCLVAEEIFVNICSYAYGEEQGSVEISLEGSGAVILRFRDGGKPFDPLKDVTDIDSYDIDTQIGGLGRRIAFDIMDEVHYEYRDGKNILTLIKYLKEEK